MKSSGAEKKRFEAPKLNKLGTVQKLTEGGPEIPKCSGRADIAFPQELSFTFHFDCD